MSYWSIPVGCIGLGEILPSTSSTSSLGKCIGAVGSRIRQMLLDLSNAHGPSDHVPRPAVAVSRAAATPRDRHKRDICVCHQGGPIPTNILPTTNLLCTTISTGSWGALWAPNSGYFWFCGCTTHPYRGALYGTILVTVIYGDFLVTNLCQNNQRFFFTQMYFQGQYIVKLAFNLPSSKSIALSLS